jgi:hypothetical protein
MKHGGDAKLQAGEKQVIVQEFHGLGSEKMLLLDGDTQYGKT